MPALPLPVRSDDQPGQLSHRVGSLAVIGNGAPGQARYGIASADTGARFRMENHQRDTQLS